MLPAAPIATAAVIPCRDEAAAIGPLVAAVRFHLDTVFVVDDGSRDATARLAAKAGAVVLRHDSPRGKGAALRTGWAAARERGFAWALSLDGDGQHSPEDIPAFFERAAGTAAPLIIGNRMSNLSGMPWLRRSVNRWMSRRLSAIAGHNLPDSQCGFRLINLEAWSGLKLQTDHYEIESELLLAFLRAGFPAEFVSIRVIYQREHSKINPLTDTLRWFRWYRRHRDPQPNLTGHPQPSPSPKPTNSSVR